MTVLYRRGRFSAVFDPRSFSIGPYFGDVFCTFGITVLVLRWRRRAG